MTDWQTMHHSGAAGYDEMFARVTRSFIPALLTAARIGIGQRVLDVATGTGAAAQAVADLVRPSGEIVAGDISSTMLEVAKRNQKKFTHPVRAVPEEAQAAIDRYFAERNAQFRTNPKRAGDKIWGKERERALFSEANNCKDPRYTS